MPKVSEAKAIEMEVRVKAKPETVYQLLTDPAKYHKWKGKKATLDPRPGGIYRVVFNEVDTVEGKYVEVVPNHRVVFTWGWTAPNHPVPTGSSKVEIDLVADGKETIVKLRHTGLPDPTIELHKMGWKLYLDRLAIVGAGGNAGPDPNEKHREMK